MSISLTNLIDHIKELCGYKIYSDKEFGVELGFVDYDSSNIIAVKGVLVTPRVDIRAIKDMIDNSINVALSVIPLPLFDKQKHNNLTRVDYETLKSLFHNNIWTLRLPSKWVHEKAFSYFAYTLGITKLDPMVFDINKTESIVWNVEHLSYNDLLANINHLTTNWCAIDANDVVGRVIVLKEFAVVNDQFLQVLSENDISTIVTFGLDTCKKYLFKQWGVNLLCLDYVDFLNIALKKFSQTLQLDAGIKVIFKPTKDSVSVIKG